MKISINFAGITNEKNMIHCVFFFRNNTSEAISSNESQFISEVSLLKSSYIHKRITCSFTQLQSPLGTVLAFPVLSNKGLDNLENLRMTAFKAHKQIKSMGHSYVNIWLDNWSLKWCDAIFEGLNYQEYNFTKYKSKQKPEPVIEFDFKIDSNDKKEFLTAITRTQTLLKGTQICRDLVNEPGSKLYPKEFAKRVKSLLQKNKSVKIKIRELSQLKRENYNGLVTVGKGSPHAPCLVTLKYNGDTKSKTHWGLVGKGVTFDTGGISLKPGDDMWEMKSDMAGAATVFASFLTAVKLQLPIKLTAVLCLAENRPSGEAVLPGDIFTAKNGKTVMVDNTDAEGRLVLSDGLAEAELQGATHIIDLATLTGAIVRAIGPSMTGLFSNDDALAQSITQAGSKVGEKFWRMPLEQEYREGLNDTVADLSNLGKCAGAITAALFLQEFVSNKTKWAHLDIAGTAFITKPWKYYNEGATGWGVRSLIALLSQFE